MQFLNLEFGLVSHLGTQVGLFGETEARAMIQEPALEVPVSFGFSICLSIFFSEPESVIGPGLGKEGGHWLKCPALPCVSAHLRLPNTPPDLATF